MTTRQLRFPHSTAAVGLGQVWAGCGGLSPLSNRGWWKARPSTVDCRVSNASLACLPPLGWDHYLCSGAFVLVWSPSSWGAGEVSRNEDLPRAACLQWDWGEKSWPLPGVASWGPSLYCFSFTGKGEGTFHLWPTGTQPAFCSCHASAPVAQSPDQAPKHIWPSQQTLLQGERAQNSSGQKEGKHLTCYARPGNDEESRNGAWRESPPALQSISSCPHVEDEEVLWTAARVGSTGKSSLWANFFIP